MQIPSTIALDYIGRWFGLIDEWGISMMWHQLFAR